MNTIRLALTAILFGGAGWPSVATNSPLAQLSSFAAAEEPHYVATFYGNFVGTDDAQADRLDVWTNPAEPSRPYQWWVLPANAVTWTLYYRGVGPGERTLVGNFDTGVNGQNGYDDLLLFSGQWNLLSSTGSTFEFRLDVNPGFTVGWPRECAANYDSDFASEVIMESTYNTCWNYDATISRFSWTHCSRTCDFPRPLYYAENEQLYAAGGTPVFLKGTTYLGCRGVGRYAYPPPPAPEAADPFLFMMADCPVAKLRTDLSELKARLGINTVRILTVGPQYAELAHYPAWYNADGSISPAALAALQGILDVARDLGLRVTLALYVGFDPGNARPGSGGESLAFAYLHSLGTALSTDPALFSYEITPESVTPCEPSVPPGTCVIHQTPGEPNQRAASLFARMAWKLKQADGNHLITTGLVSVSPAHSNRWYYPSPEFAAIPDIDNLNQGQPFNLYSRMDYLSPHLYAGNAKTDRGSIAEMMTTLNDIKAWRDGQPVRKPITLGEAGYDYGLMAMAGLPNEPRSPGEEHQRDFFTELGAGLDATGARGLLVFNALPQLPLIPTYYTMEQPYPDVPIVTYTFGAPQRRVQVHAGDLWNVFYPVEACQPGPWCEGLSPRPAFAPIHEYFTTH